MNPRFITIGEPDQKTILDTRNGITKYDTLESIPIFGKNQITEEYKTNSTIPPPTSTIPLPTATIPPPTSTIPPPTTLSHNTLINQPICSNIAVEPINGSNDRMDEKYEELNLTDDIPVIESTISLDGMDTLYVKVL